MFERFTHEARRVVERAQVEARARGRLGTEHLLLGLFGDDTVASRALQSLGIDRLTVVADVRAVVGEPREEPVRLDPDALASLGIDLDEVRRAVEASFGPGALEETCAWRGARALRFTPGAKKALELSLREALHLGHRHLGPEHILLGLLREGQGPAAATLRRRAGSVDRVRVAVLERLRRPA